MISVQFIRHLRLSIQCYIEKFCKTVRINIDILGKRKLEIGFHSSLYVVKI